MWLSATVIYSPASPDPLTYPYLYSSFHPLLHDTSPLHYLIQLPLLPLIFTILISKRSFPKTNYFLLLADILIILPRTLTPEEDGSPPAIFPICLVLSKALRTCIYHFDYHLTGYSIQIIWEPAILAALVYGWKVTFGLYNHAPQSCTFVTFALYIIQSPCFFLPASSERVANSTLLQLFSVSVC